MTQQEFQEKYLPLARGLFRTAAALMGNVQDAEDAVQETYLKLWREASRLAAMEQPEAYFATVLRHVCINLLRSRRSELQVECVADHVPDSNVGTAERFDNREHLSLLLRRLSPRDRRIVTLRHVAGRSTAEIAVLTGETETNVRVVLSRTRRKLKEEHLKNL
ncbi:MAG: RNA polymerase sigma factor [Bacteroidaceae bacterium]|nr:RNA polymerase sigma factor [Bacteroidaceae bacterium]